MSEDNYYEITINCGTCGKKLYLSDVDEFGYCSYCGEPA